MNDAEDLRYPANRSDPDLLLEVPHQSRIDPPLLSPGRLRKLAACSSNNAPTTCCAGFTNSIRRRPIPLDHKDAYTLLVAVLLSAQCTDVRVNQVTPALFKLADNPHDMMHVPVAEIQAIIRPCGLSPKKVGGHFRALENPRRAARRRGSAGFRRA